MYRDKERYGQDPTTVLRSKSNFNDPLKWKEPKRVFTCSWSDFFIEEADPWRAEAWDIIKKTPHLTYQILTKRPERIVQCLPKDWGDDGYENVWLGFSAENTKTFEKRADIFLNQINARIRFVSFEPLIESIDPGIIREYDIAFEWAIIGGESGNESGRYRYRRMEWPWAIEIVNVLQILKIPVFVKQLGTYTSKLCEFKDRHGGNIDEWPYKLRVRQFPNPNWRHDGDLIAK
jgi:protein gp37